MSLAHSGILVLVLVSAMLTLEVAYNAHRVYARDAEIVMLAMTAILVLVALCLVGVIS